MLPELLYIHSTILDFVPTVLFLYFFGLSLYLPLWFIVHKKQSRKLYNFFHYFYRISLGWIQTAFGSTALISKPEQLRSIDHLYYLTGLAFLTWIVEQSNLIVFYLHGKKITYRRICYSICSFLLIYQNLYRPSILPILFLSFNYICDLCKNTVLLFYYNRSIINTTNRVFKPMYFMTVLCLTIFHIKYLDHFLVSFMITCLSFYDALKYSHQLL